MPKTFAASLAAGALAAGLSALGAHAWDLGARAPGAPEQLDDFAFLIGCHDVAARRWDAEAEDWGPAVTARWDGRWALDGWAIYDEWFDPDIPGQPPAIGRGANIRTVDPETGRWVMSWNYTAGTGASVARELHAEKRGDEVVMWQMAPVADYDRKSVFTVGEDGSWIRDTFVRPWGGGDWTPTGRLEAAKVDCSTRE